MTKVRTCAIVCDGDALLTNLVYSSPARVPSKLRLILGLSAVVLYPVLSIYNYISLVSYHTFVFNNDLIE